MRCLIVDDSKVVRKLARRMIEPLGFECHEAENGQEALTACASAMPDCILLDWHMPVMDGMGFIQSLRAMPEGKAPKVIFCTTENEMSSIMQALAAGADEYVMKPFNEEIIRDKLAQVGLIP